MVNPQQSAASPADRMSVSPAGGSRMAWPRRRYPRQVMVLGAVAVCYGLVQYVVTRRVPLGWDETVYVSQVTRGVPAAVFSAPRARGIVLLVAPASLITGSVAAIRAYLSVLSAAGLALAYWPWLKVRGGVVVPLAAGLFAAQWLSIFYGNEAMPNPYVAFGAVAATGWFLRMVAEPGRWGPRAGLAAAVTVTTLMRPFDAFWIVLSLVAAAIVKRRWAPVVTAGIGVVAGGAEWIVEAYVSYGGPLVRLHAAGADNETGLHLSLGAHLRALDGPLLCRPPASCGSYPWSDVLWFAAIPVLAIAGLVLLRRERSRHLRAAVMAATVAATTAASYFVIVGYAAPRFLMAAYALAALPVAEGITALCRHAPGRLRVAAVVLAVGGVAAYAGVQVQTLSRLVPYEHRVRTADVQAAGQLKRLGITAPCLLYGRDAVQIAYYVRCSSFGIMAHWGGAQVPTSIRTALAAGRQVAVTARTKKPPAAFLRTWQRRPLPGVTATGHWYVYLPPHAP
ncbi:MAG: hypothetical protein JWP48_5786 [Actinoallomurus sp.]|jgi:hypothetical protein|nr:hypothetical protein [Actinoallomurus sp.]